MHSFLFNPQLLLRFKRDKDTIDKPTVTAVMGIKWNELTSTDPKDAWCLTSVEIAKELFQSQMIVVPKLDEAPFFDLMVCFTKPGNKTALEKVSNLIKGEYDFQLRGHLTDLIDKEGSNLSKTHLACKNTVQADVDQKSLSHEWESPDGNKVVKIKLDGISKEVINWASLNEGDLIFDIDLSGRKRIYIISEVVYASKTSILVKVGDTERSEKVSLKIPVAFSYAKFPVDKNGELKQVINEMDINVASTFAPANF